MTTATVVPFSNGSEFSDWQANNCLQCRKYRDNINCTCKYEAALSMAYMNTGKITKRQAKIMGLDTNDGDRKCTIRIHHTCPRKKRVMRSRIKSTKLPGKWF